jgi:hypothetical protein
MGCGSIEPPECEVATDDAQHLDVDDMRRSVIHVEGVL